MNQAIEKGRKRLVVYFLRVSRALDSGKREQALSDLAELAFIARRLWEDLSKETDGK
jgi:hypothetical protein